MSAVVKAELAPYVLYIKLAIVAVIVGVIGYQHWRIGSLKHENGLLAAATQGYAGAQKTNLDTIGNLQSALQDMIQVNRMDEARASAAASQSATTQKAITDRLTATEKELSNVYATNANARAWGAIGVDAAVLARLPKPAAASTDARGGKAGARAGTATADAHAH